MSRMLSSLRGQALGVSLAIVALFVALGGTSIAVTGGTGHTAKPVAHGAKAKGSRGPRGFRGSRGKTGPQGPRGAQGVQGPQGAPGRSALTPLQPGETETGVVGFDGEAPAATGDFRVTASFPIPLSAAPTDAEMVGVSAGASVCTGTAAAPTAPARTLCVYPSFATNPSLAPGSHTILTTPAGQLGFRVAWSVGATGDTFFIGSYAVTG